MSNVQLEAEEFSTELWTGRRILGTINNYLFLDLPPFLAFAGTTLVAYRILFATARRVTKLSQIRTRSDGAQGIETKTSLRLQTGKQDLWGKGSGVRDLNIADVRVEAVPGRKSSYLVKSSILWYGANMT